MFKPGDIADRRAAAALLEGVDGYEDLGLLPGLCRRDHFDAARRAVLRRADLLMATRRGQRA